MRDLIRITQFERLGDYRLRLWFTDGQVGEWSFAELAARDGPLTRPLKDVAYFDRVFLQQGGLTWPNGYDWSPEALHADMSSAGVLARQPAAA